MCKGTARQVTDDCKSFVWSMWKRAPERGPGRHADGGLETLGGWAAPGLGCIEWAYTSVR